VNYFDAAAVEPKETQKKGMLAPIENLAPVPPPPYFPPFSRAQEKLL